MIVMIIVAIIKEVQSSILECKKEGSADNNPLPGFLMSNLLDEPPINIG